jgi:hypothetical protein
MAVTTSAETADDDDQATTVFKDVLAACPTTPKLIKVWGLLTSHVAKADGVSREEMLRMFDGAF